MSMTNYLLILHLNQKLIMAQTKLGENTVNLNGDLPAVGTKAPDFQLTSTDLTEKSLASFPGKNLVLNIFPSIDTRVCATSVREFNKRASNYPDTAVLCIAKDLPYAFRRFCGAEGITNVESLSDFRDKGFSKNYGVLMTDGIMAGLFARAIVVIDKEGKIKHTELVPVIGQEPNYDAALDAIS
jgi:thioredoxin-dependent peroxiredoxin